MWARLAAALWLALALVTWNVVFDRGVFLASAAFAQANVERWQHGDPVSTIDAAYRPQVGRAAWRASAWAGGVLAIGGAAFWAADRSSRRNVLP